MVGTQEQKNQLPHLLKLQETLRKLAPTGYFQAFIEREEEAGSYIQSIEEIINFANRNKLNTDHLESTKATVNNLLEEISPVNDILNVSVSLLLRIPIDPNAPTMTPTEVIFEEIAEEDSAADSEADSDSEENSMETT